MREKILTFTLVFLVWILFTGQYSLGNLVVGGGLAALISFLFASMLFRVSKVRYSFDTYLRKGWAACRLIPVFIWEAGKAALLVTHYAFIRKPDFNPGIVKVSTRLHSVTAITVLANLITLTPGTLTLDYDSGEHVFTIHWIDVKATDSIKTQQLIIGAFEKRLEDIFQ